MAKFNVGNRVKCTYTRGYPVVTAVIRGELVGIEKIDKDRVVYDIIGYDTDEPYTIKTIRIFRKNIKELTGTRLDKPRSEALSKYIKVIKEKMALERKIALLEDKERQLAKPRIERNNTPLTKIEIVKEIYQRLWNNKEYAPSMNGLEKDTINIAVTLLKNQRSTKHLKIHSVSGSVWMDDFEQKDIHNHLAESSSPIRGFINVSSLENYFTVSQRLFVDMDFEGRPRFDVGVSMRLKAKDTIREEDINYIVGLFYNIMKYAKD